MDVIIKKLDKKVDERGFVVELLRSEQVKDAFGQIFLTSVLPGKIKGNHYHKRKKEWYFVAKGSVTVHLLDVESGEKDVVKLDAGTPKILQINPGVSHAITNNGKDEALVIAYISESFDPKDSDTFVKEVVKAK